jgi:hypothetical protein
MKSHIRFIVSTSYYCVTTQELLPKSQPIKKMFYLAKQNISGCDGIRYESAKAAVVDGIVTLTLEREKSSLWQMEYQLESLKYPVRMLRRDPQETM